MRNAGHALGGRGESTGQVAEITTLLSIISRATTATKNLRVVLKYDVKIEPVWCLGRSRPDTRCPSPIFVAAGGQVVEITTLPSIISGTTTAMRCTKPVLE